MLSKIFLFSIFFLASNLVGSAQTIEWSRDYAEAEKIARQTGKPLMLGFTAEWCGLCKAMDRVFWTRSDVIELSKKFVTVKIDGEKQAYLAKKFGVSGFPSVVVTDAWSLGIDSHTGFGQNGDRVIIEKVAAFPKDFTELSKFGKIYETSPLKSSALEKFADFYSSKNLLNISISLYKRFLEIENEPEKKENAMYNLAQNALKLGRPAESLVYFETLLKEYPKNDRADDYQFGIFISNLRKRNYSEAEKHLTKLKNDFPDSKNIRQAELTFEKQKSLKN